MSSNELDGITYLNYMGTYLFESLDGNGHNTYKHANKNLYLFKTMVTTTHIHGCGLNCATQTRFLAWKVRLMGPIFAKSWF